jgi:hypothetical protein
MAKVRSVIVWTWVGIKEWREAQVGTRGKQLQRRDKEALRSQCNGFTNAYIYQNLSTYIH